MASRSVELKNGSWVLAERMGLVERFACRKMLEGAVGVRIIEVLIVRAHDTTRKIPDDVREHLIDEKLLLPDGRLLVAEVVRQALSVQEGVILFIDPTKDEQ